MGVKMKYEASRESIADIVRQKFANAHIPLDHLEWNQNTGADFDRKLYTLGVRSRDRWEVVKFSAIELHGLAFRRTATPR